ncbi:diguanylate cyclase [Deinococcus sp. KNUC1210]|uniref:diguanylate cyclase domain-containing protein n=1 Tax=Deinococcus sp. KNUC1210 TaxID=2917691 RepID=UPI001EEFC72B|nr:diguanylate cyclase [Deinococcus sp. KNUC1210]ULH15200.1 diguanylate cyclase [Deinococcus sp. KNUC1210]
MVSQTFRGWPLKLSRTNAIVHVFLAVITAYVMRLYPAPLIKQGDIQWAESFADLRYVPMLTVLLGYGPAWTLLTALLMLLPDLMYSVIDHHPNDLIAPLIASMGVVTMGAIFTAPMNVLHFPWRQVWWRLLPVLLPVGVPFLLSPGGLLGLWEAVVLVLCNLLGFMAGAQVNRSRFRMLAISSRLSKQAHTDALTGLWNRRQFEHDLDTLKPGGWVLVIDLDHFKTINDRFGHDVGDEYLVGAADALSRSLPRNERAYRLGGEEFAILLSAALPGEPDTAETAREVAEAVLLHMREVSHPTSTDRQLSCSVGMARLFGNETPQAAQRRADLALFRAKANGRNRTEIAGTVTEPPTLPGEDLRALQPLFVDKLQSSIEPADTDHELTDAEWMRLLQIAILSVPNAELGSIDVREGEFFVQRAQIGFSAELLGTRYSRAAQLYWYGLGEKNWRQGEPRLMTGEEILMRSSMPVPEHEKADDIGKSGRIHELKTTLCIPLLLGNEVIAHLNLDRVSDSHPFSEQDLQIARIFASQVTVLMGAARRREAWSRYNQMNPVGPS